MDETPQNGAFGKNLLSSVSIEVLDPLADSTWDNFVSNFQDHTVFHRSAWARVLADTYGHRPFYLKVSVAGTEAALVPLMEVNSCITGRRGISLPFSDFAGPLWMDRRYADAVYAGLLDFACQRKWKHLEFRGGSIPPAGVTAFQTYASHQLDLRQGVDAIESGYDPAVRRAIRKSEQSGLEITIESNMNAMNAFYSLHGRTRKRHGLPPQPLSFFQSIAKNLVANGLGSVVLARTGGVPVAGAVFLHSGNQAVYKFGASDSEYWPARPNHGVMAVAIRALIKAGYANLHFGRTSPNDEGLIRFKLSWGAVAQSLTYHRYHCHSHRWLSATAAPVESYPVIFGRLPLACNRFAGRLIYPHLD